MLVTVVLALCVYYMLAKSSKSFIQEKFNASSALSSNNQTASSSVPVADITVMLFYATWCGHCEKYLAGGTYDTFDAIVKADKSINAKVAFVKYDYDKYEKLADRYGISAFPSIVAVDADEKVYRFSGNRENGDDMIKFIKGIVEKRTFASSEYVL